MRLSLDYAFFVGLGHFCIDIVTAPHHDLVALAKPLVSRVYNRGLKVNILALTCACDKAAKKRRLIRILRLFII